MHSGPYEKLVIRSPLGDRPDGPRATDSLSELLRLRHELASLDTLVADRTQRSIVETLATAGIENSVVQHALTEYFRQQRWVDLLGKPLSEILAEQRATLATFMPAIRLMEIHRELSWFLSSSVANMAELGGGFRTAALSGWLDLSQASENAYSSPNSSLAVVTEREVCLAGGVAAAAVDDAAVAIETRVIEAIDGIDEFLGRHLAELNPGLVTGWRGARDALATKNPDRARILSFGLRELTKGTLNALVGPQEREFDAWIKQQAAKPSLEWKVRFLLKDSRLSPVFADTDARGLVALLDHLNSEGVHNPSVPLHSDAELRAILRRVEGWLASLLELRSSR